MSPLDFLRWEKGKKVIHANGHLNPWVFSLSFLQKACKNALVAMFMGLINQKLMPWLFGSTCNHPFLIRILRGLAPCNKTFIYTVLQSFAAQQTLLACIYSATPDDNLTKFFACPHGVEKIHPEIFDLLSMFNLLNICKRNNSQRLCAASTI